MSLNIIDSSIVWGEGHESSDSSVGLFVGEWVLYRSSIYKRWGERYIFKECNFRRHVVFIFWRITLELVSCTKDKEKGIFSKNVTLVDMQ